MSPNPWAVRGSLYLDEYLGKIRHSVALLDAEQVWWRANPRSNSAGNLILHLCGNLTQWVLVSLGGEAYERHRSLEFTADRTASPDELLSRLTDVVTRCRRVIEDLPESTFAARFRIQGYDTDGVDVVFHVVEHMSYHTGQIVLLAKQLADPSEEIDFYPQHKNE
jgi:uncharacterized damage-inducible protein DinB